jgi:alkylhydroperoxidase/carboxymuconolactone decarboxylase family protein YurZ
VRDVSRDATQSAANTLCLLAIYDRAFMRQRIAAEPPGELDARTAHLARLAALVAVDAPATAYPHVVERALAEGATAEELVDVLLAVAPITGVTRVVAASPKLAAALGFDVEALHR